MIQSGIRELFAWDPQSSSSFPRRPGCPGRRAEALPCGPAGQRERGRTPAGLRGPGQPCCGAGGFVERPGRREGKRSEGKGKEGRRRCGRGRSPVHEGSPRLPFARQVPPAWLGELQRWLSTEVKTSPLETSLFLIVGALQARSGFVLGVFPFEGNFSVFSSGSVVGVTHSAPVSRCMCSPGNGLHFLWRSGCQRYRGVCQAGPSPTPVRPDRPRRALSEAPPPSRCDGVPAGLRTAKLIVPAGSGEGSGASPRLPLGPVPSEAKVGIPCPSSRLCPCLGCLGCGHRCPLLPLISRLLSRVHRNALQVRRQSIQGRDTENIAC